MEYINWKELDLKDFIKVYEVFTLDKILEIKKIIKGYINYTGRVGIFLFNDQKVNKYYSFDIEKFINEYDSFKIKNEFFSYLYIN